MHTTMHTTCATLNPTLLPTITHYEGLPIGLLALKYLDSLPTAPGGTHTVKGNNVSVLITLKRKLIAGHEQFLTYKVEEAV